jgi:hypothetical protein
MYLSNIHTATIYRYWSTIMLAVLDVHFCHRNATKDAEDEG